VNKKIRTVRVFAKGTCSYFINGGAATQFSSEQVVEYKGWQFLIVTEKKTVKIGQHIAQMSGPVFGDGVELIDGVDYP